MKPSVARAKLKALLAETAVSPGLMRSLGLA